MYILIPVLILYIGYLLREISNIQEQLNKQKKDMLEINYILQQQDKCILMLGDEVFPKIDIPYYGVVGQA
jgi:hypothetical protein